MLLDLIDKQRPGTYEFSNHEFLMKFKIWLPEDTEVEDITDVNMYKKPSASKDGEDPEPTGYCIKLSGGQASIKGQKPINVIIVGPAFKYINRYRKLKDLMFNAAPLGIFIRYLKHEMKIFNSY